MFLDFVIVLIKAGVVLFALLNLAALLTWAERKQSAFMQDRIGPNRANVGNITAVGLLHIMADGIKMIAKEDFIPEGASGAAHAGPGGSAVSGPGGVRGHSLWRCPRHRRERDSSCRWPILNVGILYIFSIASLAVYGTMLAGWASNNNYSLLGGLRASSQMISYEVSMGLSILGILMIYQSAQLDVIVREQGQLLLGFHPKVGVSCCKPVAFFLFLAGGSGRKQAHAV